MIAVCLFVNGADIQFSHHCLVLYWLYKGQWNSIDIIEISMGAMSGVCPVQNILLGSSVKTRDSCVLSSKQGVNTLLKLELLLFFIYANFAPVTAYQDDNFQWVVPNYPRRPLSLPKYALALARRLIRETTQSIW